MNKKILMISMTLFAVAMLVAPVMAKGPVNNPHAVLETTTQGAPVLDLNLPSEVTNRWFSLDVHVIVKPADKFNCPTELDVGNTYMLWLINSDYRGKWVKMSQTGYLGLFAFFGLTAPSDVPAEGVYIWGAKTD
jgi:hypothetical protein